MTPQINLIIATEQRADTQRRARHTMPRERRPSSLRRRLHLVSPRPALNPAALECCA